MTIDLEAIEARANAATPGPWTACPEKLYVFAPDGSPVAEMRGAGAEKRGQRAEGSQERNCEFIAAAQQDIRTLIAEVRRLVVELKDANYWRKRWSDETTAWADRCQAYFERYGSLENPKPRYSTETVDALLDALVVYFDNDLAERQLLDAVDQVHAAERAVRANREPAK